MNFQKLPAVFFTAQLLFLSGTGKLLAADQPLFLDASQPGESQTVSIPLNEMAFAFYDPTAKNWIAEKGSFEIFIGSSSRDLRLNDKFSLPQTVTLE